MGQAELLIAGLLVAVAGLSALARRLSVPYPIVLVVGGALLGFVPGPRATRGEARPPKSRSSLGRYEGAVDTTLTPPGTQYGARCGNPEQREQPRDSRTYCN